MILNLVQDSSVGSAPVGFSAALNALVSFFQSTFTDAITVNIAVGYGEVNGQTLPSSAVAASSTSLQRFSYAQIRSNLAADAKSADDNSAVASLPAVSPSGGTYWVATAEAKALGLSNNGGLDGAIGFSTRAFDFDPSNGVSAGLFDFFGAAVHEISEVMGRQLLVGGSVGGTSPSYEVMDLFHFASPGTRTFSGTQAGYFSPDNGATNLNNFNTDPSADFGDWAGSAGADSFLARGSTGVVLPVTANDIRVMDVLGWDVASSSSSPPPPPPPPPPPSSPPPPHKVSYDFNGDGHSDLLLQNDNGPLAMWLMDGGTIASQGGSSPDGAWRAKLAGDFNGDGKADIFWENVDGQAAVWFMNGTSLTGGALAGPNVGPSWHPEGVGDFNGDGKSDVLWQHDSGLSAIWLMDGSNVAGADLLSDTSDPAWKIISAADYDGDGKSDVLRQNSNGQVEVSLMNGTAVQSTLALGSASASLHAIAGGDFNGDGRADTLFQADDGHIDVWLTNATGAVGVQSAATIGNPGAGWHVKGTEDFNGDGKADIVLQNDDGHVGVWLMNGTSVLENDTIATNLGPSWHVDWA